MVWQSPRGMEEYLKPTELCDCNDTLLREKSREIIQTASTPKEAAVSIFYFVRDAVRFGMDYPDVKASHTLKTRIGFCQTKTNLQIALLRSVGIPARCHYVLVPKEQVKDVTPGFMYDRMPPLMGHTWCECYLAGRWLACEALYDKPLYEADIRKGFFTKEQVPAIDWDGETDLLLSRPWIVRDSGTFPSLSDATAGVKERGEAVVPSNRLFGWLLFLLINRSIDRFRRT